MTAVIAFSVSLFLLCGFLFLKRIEIRAKRIFFSGLRVRADAFLLSHAQRMALRMPQPQPNFLKGWLRFTLHGIAVFLLGVLHVIERRLLVLVHMIQGRGRGGAAPRGDSVSEFLRSVSDHKKNGTRGEIS